MNLTNNIDEEIAILNRYSITPNQLMFVKTLLILQNEDDKDTFFKYVKILKDEGIKPRDMIASLQEKNIINKFNIPDEGEEFDPYEIPVNKNFIKTFYKCSFELGKELFEVYPQFGIINNCSIPLRTVAKKFDSLEDAYFKYGKAIKWNPETHEHIIELVKWGKDFINMSLASFIVNHSWLDLEALKDGDVNNINYDSIREL